MRRQPSASSASSADRSKASSGNGFASPGLRTVGEFADGSAGQTGATVRANPLVSNAKDDADGADANHPRQSAPGKCGLEIELRALGQEGLGEQLAETEGQLSFKQHRLAGMDVEALAARLLHETLLEAQRSRRIDGSGQCASESGPI